jgi:hypothetical protein
MWSAAGSSDTVGQNPFFATHTAAVRGHPDALLQQCVTRPTEFKDMALYHDDYKRFYRPRIELTEQANGSETNINKSEAVIWFDVYMARLSKKEREAGLLKGERPEPGELATLRIRRGYTSKVDEAVKEFQILITEVYWGTAHRTSTIAGISDFEKEIDSVGLICGQVRGGPFERSLVVDSSHRIHKHSMPMAL